MISEWRAHFLGIGGSPKHAAKDYFKELAMKKCAQRNLYPENHHTAEAIAIWHCGLCQLDPAYRHRSAFQTRRAQSRRDEERARA